MNDEKFANFYTYKKKRYKFTGISTTKIRFLFWSWWRDDVTYQQVDPKGFLIPKVFNRKKKEFLKRFKECA